jgi:HEPN/Toprim N-terminal domain 1
MGSMIQLAVGRLAIDWGKNFGFADHSPLFQVTDLAQVPYYYADGKGETYIDSTGEERSKPFAELKEGMSKPLGQVVDRIALLGHTLAHCEREFEYLSAFTDFDTAQFRFDELKEALATIDVNAISADYGETGEDFEKFFRWKFFDRLRLASIAANPAYVHQAAKAMENVSAYTVLRLLALNPKARDLPVTWQFADVEDGGWAKRQEFVRPLDQSNRFLIVTEGSSDAKIIQHAFKILKPHIADFFDFVDMEEGYPFAGTGNLFRFLQGLISISIQNNVIIVYDNDAEGVANFDRSRALNVPDNMRILRLPDSPTFADFQTVGPNGRHRADINGRAAAIECYLDLGGQPLVRWNNYNTKTETYQGELIDKTGYMRTFLDQRTRADGYDYSPIEAVLDMIIENCVQMREVVADKQLEEG